MTTEQKELIKEYHRKVSKVYFALEGLKKCMNELQFKSLIVIANLPECTDDDLVEAIGSVYGDFDTFVQELPNAVC